METTQAKLTAFQGLLYQLNTKAAAISKDNHLRALMDFPVGEIAPGDQDFEVTKKKINVSVTIRRNNATETITWTLQAAKGGKTNHGKSGK